MGAQEAVHDGRHRADDLGTQGSSQAMGTELATPPLRQWGDCANVVNRARQSPMPQAKLGKTMYGDIWADLWYGPHAHHHRQNLLATHKVAAHQLDKGVAMAPGSVEAHLASGMIGPTRRPRRQGELTIRAGHELRRRSSIGSSTTPRSPSRWPWWRSNAGHE